LDCATLESWIPYGGQQSAERPDQADCQPTLAAKQEQSPMAPLRAPVSSPDRPASDKARDATPGCNRPPRACSHRLRASAVEHRCVLLQHCHRSTRVGHRARRRRVETTLSRAAEQAGAMIDEQPVAARVRRPVAVGYRTPLWPGSGPARERLRRSTARTGLEASGARSACGRAAVHWRGHCVARSMGVLSRSADAHRKLPHTRSNARADR
jgi:hypothetical protein